MLFCVLAVLASQASMRMLIYISTMFVARLALTSMDPAQCVKQGLISPNF